jgi:hypothetical protein
MANFEASNARDLVNRFINSIGARDETGVVPFVQAWPRIVGQDKAAHSQVLDVKNGIVLIGVDHPAWLQRLHMDSSRIVEQIRRDFPSLNARTVAFSIVEELTHAWKGETEEAPSGERNTTEKGAGARTDKDETRSPGSDVANGTGSTTSDGEIPPDEAGREESAASPDSAPSAEEDDSFQKKLEDLRRALEEKERSDS